jgi:hypothetical protein
MILTLMVLVLISWIVTGWAQSQPPGAGIAIDDLTAINIPTSAFTFNPATGKLEGAGSDPFAVRIIKAGAKSGTVNITRVVCPITKFSSLSNTAGYLSAFLSRNDLVLPSPSITNVVLTVWIKVPLTEPVGTYSGGEVVITAIANF